MAPMQCKSWSITNSNNINIIGAVKLLTNILADFYGSSDDV